MGLLDQLETCSRDELKQLMSAIPRELSRRDRDDRAKVVKQAEELAKQFGLTLGDLAAAVAQRKQRVPVAIKYQHPENPDLGWTGRGRMPSWVKAWLDGGGALENLIVQNQNNT